MKTLSIILIIFFSLVSFAEAKKPDSEKILKEGQLLFRLEKASWNATDDLLERFPFMRDKIGGYLSYETEQSKINTIFYGHDNFNHILVRYQFDSLPQKLPIFIDTINKDLTEIEKALITIRQDAMDKVSADTEKFFIFYKNTSYNLIPLVNEKERKVLILTGPKADGVVLIGNDYLLTYDSNNKFTGKKKLHNSLIQLDCKSKENKDKAVVSMHSHVVSDVIDPTDICTLLLYRDFVEWKQHIVLSNKYVSILDMEKEKLVIITRKAWDRLGKVNEKK